MAFLGIFGKKSDSSAVRKHGERVANKRAQAYDRWESIQALAQLKSAEAVAALLRDRGLDPMVLHRDVQK